MNSSECTICMEYFDEKKQRPRCLPCGHTFCNTCIDHSIAIGDKACATCRKPHKASKASALPVNFLVEEILKEKHLAINSNQLDISNKPQPEKNKKGLLGINKKDIAKVSSVKSDRTHTDTFCDSCYSPVIGFRYKCLICDNYDLCQNCEKNITHTQHPMLRIPSPQTKYDDGNKMKITCENVTYDPTFVHANIMCDCCDVSVVGYRYKCLNCEDFDLCHTCEHEEMHSHHVIVRMPTTTDTQMGYKRKRGADSYQDVGPARLSLMLYEECKVQ